MSENGSLRAGSLAIPVLSVAVWGGMFVVMAGALPRVDAVHLTAVRYLLATLVLGVILVATRGRRALRTDGRLVEVAVLGVVGIAGFNLLASIALGYTAPQNAALMVALTPLLTVLVRWVRDRTRPAAATVGLMGVALAGVLLVITHGHPTELSSVGSGDIMALVGVLGWAVYTHGSGRFTGWGALRFSTLTQLVGAVATVLVAAVADLTGLLRLPGLSAFAAVSWQIGYMSLLSSVIAVLAWNVAIRRLGSPNAALFMNLVPVITFGIQMVRGYHPVPAELAGAGITVAALVASNVLARGRVPAPAAVTGPAQRAPVADAVASAPAEPAPPTDMARVTAGL